MTTYLDNTIKHPKCPNDFLVWRLGMGNTLEILDLSVCNIHRRLGRGRWLINQLLLEPPIGVFLVFAITRISNIIAQEFYESIGFRIVGRLHQFYRNREGYEHALMYGKDLHGNL